MSGQDLLMKRIAGSFTLLVLFMFALVCQASEPAAKKTYPPPWSKPMVKGVNATVPGVENVPDLHGDINDPSLVVFFAGNQYMLVNDLLSAYVTEYPSHARVFAETLPPGILVQQVKTGSLVIGNMRIGLHPDVFAAGHGRMMSLENKYNWFSVTADYARNRLAIMTAAGNPKHIAGWKDLAAPSIRLCMPNPKWEGIAQHAIIPALRETGGEALVNTIYKTKVADGTTLLTRIHHRQTPMGIMAGQCDAGAVWYTEAYFHSVIAGHPLGMVKIPANHNKVMTYTMGIMNDTPHKRAAGDFMKFVMSAKGQAIYRKYGFMSPPPE